MRADKTSVVSTVKKDCNCHHLTINNACTAVSFGPCAADSSIRGKKKKQNYEQNNNNKKNPWIQSCNIHMGITFWQQNSMWTQADKAVAQVKIKGNKGKPTSRSPYTGKLSTEQLLASKEKEEA